MSRRGEFDAWFDDQYVGVAFAIALNSETRSVRITAPGGAYITAHGVQDSRDLLAAGQGLALFAADAAEQERSHAPFLTELGWPRIWCARTYDRTIAPTALRDEFGEALEKPLMARTGQEVAALMEAHDNDDVTPVIGRHAGRTIVEERLLRQIARRGFLLDRPLLTIERQSRHRALADFARTYGVDIRHGDKVRAGWLARLGVRVTPSSQSGWTSPSRCDTSAMPTGNAEAFDAYSTAFSVDKRVRVLDGLERLRTADNRVHPLFRANAAATGRMTVSNPGLHSMFRELRGVFLAEPGYDIVGVDHSSAELLVLARLVGDPGLIARVMTSDPYQELADLAGVPRSVAKVQLLAWCYGKGVRKMTKELGREQATAVMAAIQTLFPEIVAWRAEQTRRATGGEKLATLTGRPLPDLGARSSQLGLAANLQVQGSARDAFGRALLKAAKVLGDDRIWFVLHDEIFALSPKGKADETSVALVDAMTIDLGEGVQLTGKPSVYRHRWGK